MADLNTHTLFGEKSAAEVVPWPHGYGSLPPLVEHTLFGELALWRVFSWPHGYGHT
jgi:hypothetical protein